MTEPTPATPPAEQASDYGVKMAVNILRGGLADPIPVPGRHLIGVSPDALRILLAEVERLRAGPVPDTGHQDADPMDLGEAIVLVRARVDSLSYLDFGVSDDLDAVRTVLAAAAAASPDTGQPAAASAARCAADEGEACICRSDEPCMLSTCPDSACHAVERAAIAAAEAGVDAASAAALGAVGSLTEDDQ